MAQARYLRFENIDIAALCVSSQCSACGREFNAEPLPKEKIEDVVQRVRGEFNKHVCGTAEGGVIVQWSGAVRDVTARFGHIVRILSDPDKLLRRWQWSCLHLVGGDEPRRSWEILELCRTIDKLIPKMKGEAERLATALEL